jgi:hypothetical protein
LELKEDFALLLWTVDGSFKQWLWRESLCNHIISLHEMWDMCSSELSVPAEFC